MRTHYQVLGISPDAPRDRIRAAYRQLARDHHPDRVLSSSAVGRSDMPAINEAYRVLNDPGRRALYDRGLSTANSSGFRITTDPGEERSTDRGPSDQGSDQSGSGAYLGADMLRPARVPWRSLLFVGVIAVVGVVVLAQFSDDANPAGPDGILRIGDCIEVLANSDAKEIGCTGDGDLVVRAFIPFDSTCPGLTVPHRDRQGMGVACVDLAT